MVRISPFFIFFLAVVLAVAATKDKDDNSTLYVFTEDEFDDGEYIPDPSYNGTLNNEGCLSPEDRENITATDPETNPEERPENDPNLYIESELAIVTSKPDCASAHPNHGCPRNSQWLLGKPCLNSCDKETGNCFEMCSCICNEGYCMTSREQCVKKCKCSSSSLFNFFFPCKC